MNLKEQADVDRFMMSDSLRDVIPDFEKPQTLNKASMSITTSTRKHSFIGQLIGVNRSKENVTLILQLQNDDQVDVLNDLAAIGNCDVEIDAGRYFQRSGPAEVSAIDVEVRDEGPRITVTINGTSPPQ